MATIDDIVKHSGVSRSTVFRFLNGNNVRIEAKKAILRAMEECNYKKDLIYKNQNIVIEISTSKNFESFQGFTEIVQGITQKADEKGIQVRIVRRSGEQIETDYSKWNSESETKGVIIVGKSIDDEEKEVKMLIERQIPHVFVNRVLDHPAISYVSVDLKKAAFDMLQYLIQKGHSDIAILGNPKKLRADRDKLEGYRLAFSQNDTKVSENHYYEVDQDQQWEEYWKKILLSENRPTAYFGICDSYAMKFIHTAQSMGYKIPEDMAVVGMDDVEASEYLKPALTTVHIPFKKMGSTAVEQLLQLITDDGLTAIKTIVKHSLVIRESCNKQV